LHILPYRFVKIRYYGCPGFVPHPMCSIQ
jgi:hypothetical protein